MATAEHRRLARTTAHVHVAQDVGVRVDDQRIPVQCDRIHVSLPHCKCRGARARLSRFVEQANQLLEALEAGGRPSDTGELRAPAHQRERLAQRTRPTDAFFSNLTPDQLIELRDHGITPAFVREMRELGFTDLSPDDLVELRDHGVNAAFIREMPNLGFEELTPDELVDEAYLCEIKAMSTEELPPGRPPVVGTRDHATIADQGHAGLEHILLQRLGPCELDHDLTRLTRIVRRHRAEVPQSGPCARL